MTGLPITSLYAALLGLILVALSWGVVQIRLAREVSLGTEGHDDLNVAQRRQGNFIEYVPMAVILLALVEFSGTAAWIVHTLGATLVVARAIHPFGLAVEFGLRPARFLGASATWIVIVVESGLLIVGQLG
jgi:uncharacterized membrane protein YecN with MAPEG domain